MNNNRLIKDDLEYNDGLGDMLREREREEFSWVKTWFSAIAIVVVVLVVFVVGFQLAKFTIAKKTENVAASRSEVAKIDTQEEIESEIAKIEAQTEAIASNLDASATESVSMDPPPPVVAPTPVAKPIPRTPVAVAKPAPAPEKPSATRDFKVVVGSFGSRENAQAQVNIMAQSNIPAFIWSEEVGGRIVYRIQVGAYYSQAQANTAVAELGRKGISAVIIKK